MSFKGDVPNYISIPDGEYYMHTLPRDIWNSMESLIRRSANEPNQLKMIINTIAEITGGPITYNWGWDFLENDIPVCVHGIRKKVEDGRVYRFDAFMDCLTVLHKCGDLTCDIINEYLEDHGIGYQCDAVFGNLKWYISNEIEDNSVVLTSNGNTSITSTATISIGADNERQNVDASNHMTVFLSYSHKDSVLADTIDKNLSGLLGSSVTISRDVRDVDFHQSFIDFMKSIHSHDYVLMLISDNYLKSKNCMYEMMEALRDPQYTRRIIPIVISEGDKTLCGTSYSGWLESDIFSVEGEAVYIKFWERREIQLKREISDLNDISHGSNLLDEVRCVNRILVDMPDFFSFLRDSKGLSLSEHESENYSSLIGYIKN